jgi:predicted DNA-binding transcriptional regulator YafY
MSKSKRLIELMMVVNRRRQFTVKELAQEFGISRRTMLRDLQELSELGVPLYSEVGPHGGYRVLNARVLPPISFTEDEAAAIFFAIHALRHYVYHPFDAEYSSAWSKFYHFMPEDVRNRIDKMKTRVDFVTPHRQVESPHLPLLLDAAIHQKVLAVEYQSYGKTIAREIQPIGIFARNGLWYCPAHCFLREEMRLFRCDRIVSAAPSERQPLDLRDVHLENGRSLRDIQEPSIEFYAELTREGVERCETEAWLASSLYVNKDGTGWLDGRAAERDIPFLAKFFVGLGDDGTVMNPPTLVDHIGEILTKLTAKYRRSETL